MTIEISTAIEALAGVITVVGGFYAAIKMIFDARKKRKLKEKASLLKEAKDESIKIISGLELKITEIENELRNQKESISKDLSHLKENYSNEIKGLAEKIENVREQLNQQHIQLVALLTRMIDSK